MFSSIMSKWMSLHDCILERIVLEIPNPIQVYKAFL